MDKYANLRTISFDNLASVLGIDLNRFKRKKEEWQGYCPVHNSKSNNNCFSYHDSGKFHCFSCSAKGAGAIDLAKLVKEIGFQDAVALLETVSTALASRTSPNQKTPHSGHSNAKAGAGNVDGAGGVDASSETNEPTNVLTPYHGQYHKFPVPCPWLEQRIPDSAVLQTYGVFAYNNPARKSAYSGRVMLPVKDAAGILYGYLGRQIDNTSHSDGDARENTPKYLFPRNLPKSRFLFGAAEILAGKSDSRPLRVCYLLESPFAVMRFAMYGLPAVSPFGWSVSSEQVEILRQLCRGVVYLPDANKRQDAGVLLSELAQHLWCRFPRLPGECVDPEHLTREQVLAL